MSTYWKDHYDSNALQFSNSPLRQVDRTVNGKEIGREQIDLTINAVLQNLKLAASDVVVDLCCGNGLITAEIARATRKVIAVDFSERLILLANASNSAPNVEYLVSDVTELNEEFIAGANKFYMRDSVSCLSSEELLNVLLRIAGAPLFEAFFVAGFPDAERLDAYYDNDEKLAFYRRRQAEGKPHIGTWWSRGEIEALAELAGLGARFIPQDVTLASAYYRYDCLFEPTHPH